MVGLYKALTDEDRDQQLRDMTMDDPAVENRTDEIPRSERLTTMIAVVSSDQARTTMGREVVPAVLDIAHELEEYGVTVSVMQSNYSDVLRPEAEGVVNGTVLPSPGVVDNRTAAPCDSVVLRAGENGGEFTYQVSVEMKPSPSFAGHMVRHADLSAHLTVRVTGRHSPYDILGYTRDQVRHDIVDNYERHLQYLALQG